MSAPRPSARGWWGRALGAALALALGSAARAGDKPPPVQIVSIDLGWENGTLVRDRWQPATVWITSADKPFTGMLSVKCPQDAVQTATMLVGPVSTTPGQVIPVEVPFLLSGPADTLEFTLSDGRYTTTANYTQRRGPDDLPMPHVGGGHSGLFVMVGKTSAATALDRTLALAAFESRIGPSGTDSQAFSLEGLWNATTPAAVALDRLPWSWAAYESADLVVADEEALSRAEPRAREALMQWVQSGGRLALRLDMGSAAWPRLVPVTEGGPPLRCAGVANIPASSGYDDLIPANAPAAFQARVLTLTEEGRRMGWKVMPSAEAEVSRRDGTTGSQPPAVMGYGPVGLGMVMLVGVEPSGLSALQRDATARAFWRAALEPMLSPHARRGGEVNQGYWWAQQGDPVSGGALNAVLDSLAEAPAIGIGVFVGISACMLALALMIGPVDAKVLKRLKKSQHSWKTALAWIGIACLAAVVMPRLLRSGETTVSRVLTTDTICDARGNAERTAVAAGTGVFAGRSLAMSLSPAYPGTFMHNASVTTTYWDRGGQGGDMGLVVPIATDTGDGPVRSAWAQSFRVPQWSFRTFAESSPLSSSHAHEIGARVQRDGEGWTVMLTHVPEGVRFSRPMLRLGTKWYELHPLTAADAPVSGGRCTLATGPEMTPTLPVDYIDEPATPSPATPWHAPQQGPNAPLLVPFARERAQAIATMVESGRWAGVYVRALNMPMDVDISKTSRLTTKCTAVLRLLAPLEGEP